MNSTSEHIRLLQSAIEHPSRGVVGIVDDLLNVCWKYGLQLDWQANRCRVRSAGSDWVDLPELSIRQSSFRAVLARIAALCNEQSSGSVSPYGGQGELSVGTNPPVVFEIAFVNTPEEQRLELMPRTASSASTFPGRLDHEARGGEAKPVRG
jgi:hypothetical protein